MTAITIDLTAEEKALLNATPESQALKWAYHSILPMESDGFRFMSMKMWIHRLIDPIHAELDRPTDGYTPYNADGRPATSNEDAIGYTAQFFGRKPHGRDWVDRSHGQHRWIADGWEEAYDELFDERTWDLWCSIRAKVCEARIRAGLDPFPNTLPSYIEQIKEAMRTPEPVVYEEIHSEEGVLTPDAVDEIIAISSEEDSLPRDKDGGKPMVDPNPLPVDEQIRSLIEGDPKLAAALAEHSPAVAKVKLKMEIKEALQKVSELHKQIGELFDKLSR